jgi:hypothetical protein
MHAHAQRSSKTCGLLLPLISLLRAEKRTEKKKREKRRRRSQHIATSADLTKGNHQPQNCTTTARTLMLGMEASPEKSSSCDSSQRGQRETVIDVLSAKPKNRGICIVAPLHLPRHRDAQCQGNKDLSLSLSLWLFPAPSPPSHSTPLSMRRTLTQLGERVSSFLLLRPSPSLATALLTGVYECVDVQVEGGS